MLWSYLPSDWREQAMDARALKGLRKDKSADVLPAAEEVEGVAAGAVRPGASVSVRKHLG